MVRAVLGCLTSRNLRMVTSSCFGIITWKCQAWMSFYLVTPGGIGDFFFAMIVWFYTWDFRALAVLACKSQIRSSPCLRPVVFCTFWIRAFCRGPRPAQKELQSSFSRSCSLRRAAKAPRQYAWQLDATMVLISLQNALIDGTQRRSPRWIKTLLAKMEFIRKEGGQEITQKAGCSKKRNEAYEECGKKFNTWRQCRKTLVFTGNEGERWSEKSRK